MTTQTPATAEIEEVTPDSGPVFPKFLTPGSGPGKMQNPARDDSGQSDPVPTLVSILTPQPHCSDPLLAECRPYQMKQI